MRIYGSRGGESFGVQSRKSEPHYCGAVFLIEAITAQTLLIYCIRVDIANRKYYSCTNTFESFTIFVRLRKVVVIRRT